MDSSSSNTLMSALASASNLAETNSMARSSVTVYGWYICRFQRDKFAIIPHIWPKPANGGGHLRHAPREPVAA